MLDEFDIDCEDKKVIIEEKHYFLRCIPVPYFRPRFSTLSKKTIADTGLPGKPNRGTLSMAPKSSGLHGHMTTCQKCMELPISLNDGHGQPLFFVVYNMP